MFTAQDFISKIGEENVSRETFLKLESYVELLKKWQKSINLVSTASLSEVWERHILDCAQLINYIPSESRKIIDFGSGAGLPILILAIMLESRNNKVPYELHAIESDSRKVAFMREAVKNCGLSVNIHNCRIEQLAPFKADIITARAFAPLSDLLTYVYPFITKDSVCLFLKGQNIDTEIEKANKKWLMELELQQSLSDENGKVVIIKKVKEG